MPPVFYFCFCFSSGVDSVSVLTIQNAILKYKRSIELKRKDCEQLTIKLLKVEYKVNGLEQLLSETKEMKSQLEHQKVEWERELYSLRYDILVLRKYFNYLLFFFLIDSTLSVGLELTTMRSRVTCSVN